MPLFSIDFSVGLLSPARGERKKRQRQEQAPKRPQEVTIRRMISPPINPKGEERQAQPWFQKGKGNASTNPRTKEKIQTRTPKVNEKPKPSPWIMEPMRRKPLSPAEDWGQSAWRPSLLKPERWLHSLSTKSTEKVDASGSTVTKQGLRHQIKLKLWPVNSWRPSSSRPKMQPRSSLTRLHMSMCSC